MKVETASYSIQGGRSLQQDSVLCLNDEYRTLAALADGVGGEQGGDVASTIVTDVCKNMFSTDFTETMYPDYFLRQICALSNERMLSLRDGRRYKPMSTCALLYLKSHKAHIAHTGDSRVYHFHKGTFVKRTYDHSVIQLLLSQGKISEAETDKHPDKGKLFSCLGISEETQVDIETLSVSEGDCFLLCSDGFWEFVSTEEMRKGLAASGLDSAARSLSMLALRRSKNEGDNISVAMVRIGEPWTKQEMIIGKYCLKFQEGLKNLTSEIGKKVRNK